MTHKNTGETKIILVVILKECNVWNKIVRSFKDHFNISSKIEAKIYHGLLTLTFSLWYQIPWKALTSANTKNLIYFIKHQNLDSCIDESRQKGTYTLKPYSYMSTRHLANIHYYSRCMSFPFSFTVLVVLI